MNLNINFGNQRGLARGGMFRGHGMHKNPMMGMMRMMMQMMQSLMGMMSGQMGMPGAGMRHGGGFSPCVNPGFGRGGHNRRGVGSPMGPFLGGQNGAGTQYNGSHLPSHHGAMNGPLPPAARNSNVSGAFGSQTVGGQRSMKQGSIVLKDPGTGQVLGQYQFRNGGHGRGAIPWGDYKVSNGRRRGDRSMSSGGFGYSFDLTQKGQPHGQARDPRYGTNRSLLRVHPDGGSAGTMGCIGIVGGAAVQRDFYQKAQMLQKKYGGAFSLQFRPN